MDDSWFSSLSNWFGNLFGPSTETDPNAAWNADATSAGGGLNLPALGSGTPTAPVGNTTPVTGGNSSSIWSNPALWQGILQAGTGLAGSYMNQSSQKGLAEQYALAKQQELIANKLRDDEDRELKRRIANQTALANKRQTLSSLYNNWADNTQRGGEAAGKMSQGIGSLVGNALNARQNNLK